MQSTKYLRLRQHRHAERMRSASVAAAAGRGHPVIEGSDAMRRAFGAPSVAAAATRNAFAPSASSSSSRHAKCTSHIFMMRRAHSMMHARCAPTGGMVSLSSSARPGASRALASHGGSTWDSLALREELVAAVGEMHLAAPTEVQVAAIPRLIQGRDAMIASNTGSGKTLAYMLPLVQTLKEYEDALRDRLLKEAGVDPVEPGMYRSRRRRPRCLVLGPTRELVTQVFNVAKSVSHHCKFRASLVVGGTTSVRTHQRRQRAAGHGGAGRTEAPTDVVVATPGRFLELIEDHTYLVDDLLFVVVDEADTMFDKGFGNEVKKIMNKIKEAREKKFNMLTSPSSSSTDLSAADEMFMQHNGLLPRVSGGQRSKMCQGAFVTATLTASVSKLMGSFFPDMVTAKTSMLHKSPPNAKHNFIPLYGMGGGIGRGIGTDGMDRMSLLKNLVEKDVRNGVRTVIFCNTMDCCRAVEHELRGSGIATSCYHGGVPARQRVTELASFSPAAADAASSGEQPSSSVLVCTDLAARGLDYNCVVDHVIMFDFPTTAVDYLHRSGRTARAGRRGIITSFVASKRDARLANEIEDTIKRGRPIGEAHFSGETGARQAPRGGEGGRVAGVAPRTRTKTAKIVVRRKQVKTSRASKPKSKSR